MIGSISFTPQSTVIQYPPVQRAQPATQTAPAEDSVQLSNTAQSTLAASKAAATATQETFTQIIKDAANGDLTALAKLALVG